MKKAVVASCIALLAGVLTVAHADDPASVRAASLADACQMDVKEDKKDEEFWGVDTDIDSISRFIAQYVSDNNRWTSPKYLLGESYGTTRGAAIADYLRAKRAT